MITKTTGVRDNLCPVAFLCVFMNTTAHQFLLLLLLYLVPLSP